MEMSQFERLLPKFLCRLSAHDLAHAEGVLYGYGTRLGDLKNKQTNKTVKTTEITLQIP